MKGFLMALVLMGGAFYFIHGSGPKAKGEFFASATGEAIEITPANYEFKVTASDAPVLAYYWAPT